MAFLKEVKQEVGKVQWLKKKEVGSQFLAIHVIAGAMMLYFFGIDFIVNGIKGLF